MKMVPGYKIRKELRVGKAMARAAAKKRGYKLHPKLAAKEEKERVAKQNPPK